MTHKKIDTILVDDEPNNLNYLQALLAQYCPVLNIVAACESAGDGLHQIQSLKPQLVFMDIDMPVMSGFELLKKMEPLHFEIIFATAYNQFAMEAFEYNAVAYITKPIVTEKLIAAVEKAILKIDEKKYNQHLFTLLEDVHHKNSTDKIALPTLHGIQFITLSQICYAESHGNYTSFLLADNSKIMVSRQLGEYEKLLPTDMFVRIHDQHIINLNCIKEYIKGNGGEIILENNARLTVAARRKDELLSRFDHWLKKSSR